MRQSLLVVLTLLIAPPAAADLDWNRLASEATSHLRNYIRIDTSNPPANTRPAADFLKTILDAEGIASEIFEPEKGKATLLARISGSERGRGLLLLNHMDVVPVDRGKWSVDPFGGELRDGAIWGRGAFDMKGLGIAHLMTLVALKRAGIVPRRDVVFLATSDEETGGAMGAQWMMDHHYAKLDPEIVLDEGGFGSRDVLAPGKLVYGVSVADKRVYWLKMAVDGTSGHGSQPVAENANAILVRALGRILEKPPAAMSSHIVEQMTQAIGAFSNNKFMNAIRGNTCSLTTMRSGVGDPPKVNVIPSRAEATLDCRLLPEQNPEAFLRQLKEQAADPRVKWEIIRLAEGPDPSSTATPFFASLARVVRASQPGAVVTPIIVPYGTDGSKFRARGVPVYGFAPMVVDLPGVASMHSDEERISVAEFERGVRMFYDIVREYVAK